MNNKVIDYLKGFEEGDNITITCDFCSQVEYLEEALKSFKQIVDWLSRHNKNYTKEQYNNIIDIKDVLDDLGVE